MVSYFRTRSALFAALCILTPLFCVAGQAAPDSAGDQPPLFLSFQAPDSTATYPQSINGLMVVTGYYTTPWGATRGFVRYADGAITTFAVPGSLSTWPVSINDAGEITGSYEVLPPPYQLGFVSSVPQGFVRAADGTITTFGNTVNGVGDIHNIWVEPLAINAAGEVVGNENDGLGSTVFTRSASGIVEKFPAPGPMNQVAAAGTNALGAVIGFTTQGIQDYQGFLWSGSGTPSSPISGFTTPIIPFGSLWTVPASMNAEGTIVGCYVKGNGLFDFVRDQEGAITTLDTPGFAGCDLKVNDAGTIMGSNIPISFIKPLHGDIIPFKYPGATMTMPTSLNNLDVITGYYSKGSATQGFILVPGNYKNLD